MVAPGHPGGAGAPQPTPPSLPCGSGTEGSVGVTRSSSGSPSPGSTSRSVGVGVGGVCASWGTSRAGTSTGIVERWIAYMAANPLAALDCLRPMMPYAEESALR